jgi:hypothetical protein
MWLEKSVELEPLPRTVAKRHYTVGNDLRNNARLTPSMSQLLETSQNGETQGRSIARQWQDKINKQGAAKDEC